MSNSEINASNVLLSRYFSVNFDKEVEFIWTIRKRDTTIRKIWPKLNVIFHRYTMEAILVLNAIGVTALSGSASYINCRIYIWVTSVLGIMLIMRLYASWDEGKVTKYAVVTVSVLASLLVMAFLVLYVHDLQDAIYFLPVLNTCALEVTRLPRALVYVHSTVLAFHCLVLGLVVYKVLETPRRTNVEVLHRLQVDGLRSFMLLISQALFWALTEMQVIFFCFTRLIVPDKVYYSAAIPNIPIWRLAIIVDYNQLAHTHALGGIEELQTTGNGEHLGVGLKIQNHKIEDTHGALDGDILTFVSVWRPEVVLAAVTM
ncbi:hypothetical protein BDQ17DRAFT_1508674 [Cyathus striatus]|nr:hypothetical protein BDQ17DRAFT_1508674 [Cyathus striatus]